MRIAPEGNAVKEARQVSAHRTGLPRQHQEDGLGRVLRRRPLAQDSQARTVHHPAVARDDSFEGRGGLRPAAGVRGEEFPVRPGFQVAHGLLS